MDYINSVILSSPKVIYLLISGYDKKKNEIMPFPETWMDLKTVILSEVSQTEKQKRHMTSLISKI